MNNLLIDLNLDSSWRNLLGKNYPDRRLRDVELILRFYALLNNLSTYEPSMREFLSNYQKGNKASSVNGEIFKNTTKIINKEVGVNAFKVTRTVNKPVCDALMVSVAQILLEKKSISDFDEKHSILIQDEEFLKYVSSGTSSETSVKGRIAVARNYLLGLKISSYAF